MISGLMSVRSRIDMGLLSAHAATEHQRSGRYNLTVRALLPIGKMGFQSSRFMFTIIIVNAILVWFVWAFFMVLGIRIMEWLL
jgi:hypothetical protein